MVNKNTKKSLYYTYLGLLTAPLVYCSNDEALAQSFVYESFTSQEESVFEIAGAIEGEQLGSDISAGDLNNDGIEDLVVSAPFASNEDKKWTGRVSIVLGGNPDNREGKFSNTWGNINFYGKNSGDQLGSSVTVGDFDGDGLKDIAIGAHNAAVKSGRPGKVYIVYGKSIENRKTFDFGYKEEDLVLEGVENKDGFGLNIEAFDVNNDGIDDLLVGAPFASSDKLSNSGLVYVYLGTKDGLSDEAGVISGQTEGERFGSEIAAGDIFGDSKAEIVVGAYFAAGMETNQSGKIYLFAGRDSFKGGIKRPTSVLQGDTEMGWLGFSVDVKDVNNDGKADILSSIFSYKGDRNDAKALLYYGDEKFSETAQTFKANSKTADVTIDEPVGEAFLGAKVHLADLNGDNKAELIVGAPGISATQSVDMGDVYIVYSGEDGLEKSYSAKDKSVSAIIHGQNIDDWFGYSLTTADFNGDGFEDLVVGARYADTEESVNNGKVFVFYGKNLPFGELRPVEVPGDQISRGEFIETIVNSFELKTSNESFWTNCLEHRDFCFFNFMAMSTFDDILLEPELQLYPDVKKGDSFFEAVNVATALGIVNGFISEPDSPFRPQIPISRIQALKVILGATGLVEPKHKFELVEILGSNQALINQPSYFLDVDAGIANMWWYPRYVNFAVEKGIVEDKDYFRPDDSLTKTELNALVSRTLEYISKLNEETES